MGSPNQVDFMGYGVPFDQQPHSTAIDVVPGFNLDASDIFALIDGVQPIFFWGVKSGIGY